MCRTTAAACGATLLPLLDFPVPILTEYQVYYNYKHACGVSYTNLHIYTAIILIKAKLVCVCVCVSLM